MSEYIVNWHGVGAIIEDCWGCSTSMKAFSRIRIEKRRERIVRCKDCIHSIYETEEHDSMICLNGDQWHNEPFVNADGSGFCAWGERRDG